MQIALFGSTGRIGSRILGEALDRGHEVTAVVRDPARSPAAATRSVVGDATNRTSVAAVAAGHDAVISAVSGFGPDDGPQLVIDAARALVAGLPDAGVERLLIVGGAGSLTTPEGVRLIDRPQFPDAWKPGSRAQIEALAIFRAAPEGVNWTYLSPADLIEPGERTGSFVLGGDAAVFDADGVSQISMEDYAVALVDELEQPRHPRARFTLGYA